MHNSSEFSDDATVQENLEKFEQIQEIYQGKADESKKEYVDLTEKIETYKEDRFDQTVDKLQNDFSDLYVEKSQIDDKIRKIINASSIAGHIGYEQLGAYSSTKFAIRGLTQVAAKELAKFNITVNAYCPGIVGTDMWDFIDEKMVEENGGEKGQYLKAVIDGIALGRVEHPSDVANFVSYLASDKSDYMTGQAVQIDGGVQFI